MIYNAKKEFTSVPCGRDFFFAKKRRFLSNSGYKKAVAIDDFEKSDNGVLLQFLFY